MHALALTLVLSSLAPTAVAPPSAPPAGPATQPAPATAPAPAAAPATGPVAPIAPAPVAAPPPQPAAPAAAATTAEPPAPVLARSSAPSEAPPAPVLTAPVRSADDAAWEPQRPFARSGRWLMGTSVGLGVLGWGLAIGQSAMSRHCQPAIDNGNLEPNAGACLFEFHPGLSAMGAARGLANISNWGVAGSAGALRGNYDAIDHVWTNRAPRRNRLWIGGGIAMSVAGIVVGAVATSAVEHDICEETGCIERIPAVVLGQQAAQTIFTAGVGMFSYGMVYGYRYRKNDAYRHRIAKGTLRVAPALSNEYAGVSASGRF